jgi:hypothetical protein
MFGQPQFGAAEFGGQQDTSSPVPFRVLPVRLWFGDNEPATAELIEEDAQDES